jgi:acetylornithine/N-succinyldiaminopimelate aminotransferase
MDLPPNHLMILNDRPPVRMVRGAGTYLWDHAGTRYLDFIQGWAVNCLGHSPEVVRRAVAAQMEAVINVGPAYDHEPAIRLAAVLAARAGLDRVFLANSGAEADEGAVKLARKWGQKHKGGAFEVITARDGFHGRTLAMTCATGKAGWEDAFPPRVEGFPKVPFGDLAAIEAAIGPSTVAVMVEPIQGEAGVVVPPPGYLAGLRALCDRKGVLLILDEIQTGLARTGPLFACQDEAVRPDIITLGKGLGGGLPIAAILARADVACFERGDHGSTFGGNAVMCAAALAVLDALEAPGAAAARAASAAHLRATLERLAPAGATVRGRGHLLAMVLPSPDAEAVVRRAFELGLLLNAPRPHILRFMPSLVVATAEIDDMADRLATALRACPPLPG